MTDATVGVRQAATPDRLIDNRSLTVGAQTVYRQRVETYPGGEEVRFDYDTRTDSNPVYVGSAVPGTLTSAATWTVKKFTYDSSSRPTRVQVASGSWDNRAGLGW